MFTSTNNAINTKINASYTKAQLSAFVATFSEQDCLHLPVGIRSRIMGVIELSQLEHQVFDLCYLTAYAVFNKKWAAKLAA